jgi:Icc-related predicted phosphoesterase
VKILAMSDIHGQFHKFNIDKMPSAEDVDFVVIAGDLTNVGVDFPPSLEAYKDFAPLDFHNAKEFISALEAKYKKVWWIPGNHDWGLIDREEQFAGGLLPFAFPFEDHDFGVTIIGESLSTAFDMPHLAEIWAHTTTDQAVDNVTWLFKPPADIVVSHSPPFGILDVAPGNRHIGSRGLLKYIEHHRPKLVISGHAHECSNGYMNYKGTRVYNVATMWRVIELE